MSSKQQAGHLQARLDRVPPEEFLPYDTWQQMVQWTRTFLDHKKQAKVGEWVVYADEHGSPQQAQVVAKKPMCVQLRVSPSLTSLIPYHCISLLSSSSSSASSSSSSYSTMNNKRRKTIR